MAALLLSCRLSEPVAESVDDHARSKQITEAAE
jgi:hypothetical protein